MLSNPLTFKHHPLEGAGMKQYVFSTTQVDITANFQQTSWDLSYRFQERIGCSPGLYACFGREELHHCNDNVQKTSTQGYELRRWIWICQGDNCLQYIEDHTLILSQQRFPRNQMSISRKSNRISHVSNIFACF